MQEWFICPKCRALNNVIWDPNQTTRSLSCISCAKTVSSIEQCDCSVKPMFKILTGYKNEDGTDSYIGVLSIHNHGFTGDVTRGAGFKTKEEALENV